MSLCANFSFCSSNLFIVHSNSRIFFSQVPSGDPLFLTLIYMLKILIHFREHFCTPDGRKDESVHIFLQLLLPVIHLEEKVVGCYYVVSRKLLLFA
jgi:hypothetical protein